MVRRMKPSLVCRVDTSHGATSAYSSRSAATVAADSEVRPSEASFSSLPLDARLLLRLGRGLEADGTPGERVGPDVDGDAERPARQLLYVTLAALGMT
jgi:hypothetical protein